MKMNICRRVICILLLLSVFLPQYAVSAEKPLWELGIGVAFIQMPDYRGSDESRFYVLPYPYLVYRGDIFKIDERRISGQIFKTERILLDISGYGSAPVKSSDNSARAGMPDLDPTFEIGPSLRITLLESGAEDYKLSLAVPVRAFFSTDFHSVHREGWIFHPRINFEKSDIIPETGIKFSVSAGPMFADSSYNAYFYTVEPAYATGVRPAYFAGGGYSGSAFSASLSKKYKQFIFNIFVRTDFLEGAVIEDSPLVKAKTTVMSGFNISWIFFQSAAKVADK
ncbi:MAG: MltA-interacting protein MipA [Smithella sp. PtaU1.Bin162]|nr:MAG: MltA-interacting protein MipA [Smithella sp. PtaU1.Bin162]